MHTSDRFQSYDFNAIHTDPSLAPKAPLDDGGGRFASPALAGEVSRSDGGGLPSSPSDRSQAPSPLRLSDALLDDLFNPSIATLDLCNLHDLSLPQLADLLESEPFRIAQRSFERINASRKHIIETESQTLAAARLSDLLKDRPDTPAHAETSRKTAAHLLPRASGGGVTRQRDGGGLDSSCLPRPAGEVPSPRDGGGLRQTSTPNVAQPHSGSNERPPEADRVTFGPPASCPSLRRSKIRPGGRGKWSANGGSQGTSLVPSPPVEDPPPADGEGGPPKPERMGPSLMPPREGAGRDKTPQSPPIAHCPLPTSYCLKNKQAPLPRGLSNHNLSP